MNDSRNFRTAEELSNMEYNYFIAFKVNPKDTNSAKIEAQIKMVASDAHGGLKARRLLELKNDAIEILCNDAIYDQNSGKYIPNKGGRAKEAAAAKKMKLHEASEIVAIAVKSRKIILRSQLKECYTNVNKPFVYFTEDEFNKEIEYIKKLGVSIVENVDAKIKFGDFIEIDKLLSGLKPAKKDLYDFLGVPNNASTSEITAAKDAKYSEGLKTNVLATKQAVSNLCGKTQTILLSSPEIRKSYDQYLLLKDDVWSEFIKRKSASINQMDIDEFIRYVETAKSILKISTAQAQEIIAIGCKFFQQSIGGSIQNNELVSCPYPDCEKLIVKGQKVCPHCGRPLDIICWNCGSTRPYNRVDTNCPHCGVSESTKQLFENKCNELDLKMNKANYDIIDINNSFLLIKNLCPNYAKFPNSIIGKKVQLYQTNIDKLKAQEAALGTSYANETKTINELIAQKKFKKAVILCSGLFNKFGSFKIENTRTLMNKIEATLKMADSLILSAKQAVGRGDEAAAIDLALRTLDICSDYGEANQILQKFPPKPALNINFSISGNVIHIEWKLPLGAEKTPYTLIKKIGSAPKNVNDGSVVESGLSINFYDDKNIISATPYYYGIFAVRHGITSPIVTTQTPAVIFQEVTNINQELIENGIKVYWNPPQNVKEIIICKKDGSFPCENIEDGIKIKSEKNGFYDKEATKQTSYLVVCSYEFNGITKYSNGVKATLLPFAKLKKLEGCTSQRNTNNEFIFKCNEFTAGEISLYCSTKKIPFEYGKTLKLINFNTLCKGLVPVKMSVLSHNEISYSIAPNNIFYIYPVLKDNQSFVVSEPLVANSFEAPDVTFEQNDSILKIILPSLPLKCTGVVVNVEHNDDKDSSKSKETITYKKSDILNNSIEVILHKNKDNIVSVFMEFNFENNVTYSLINEINENFIIQESATVNYVLKRSFSNGGFNLEIMFSSDVEIKVPKLMIRKGQQRPYYKNDGELVGEFDVIQLKRKLFSKKYVGQAKTFISNCKSNDKFSVFVSNSKSNIVLKEVKDL